MSTLADKTPIARQKTDLSWSSIAKVPVVALVCYLIYLLLPFAMLLFLSVLLAVTFQPLSNKLTRYTGRKGAVALITVAGLLVIVSIALLVVPEIVAQAKTLYQDFPNLLSKLTARFPFLAEYVQTFQEKTASVDASTVSPVVAKIAQYGAVAAGSLSTLVLIFAFMVYLLLEGEMVYAWLVAFFSAKNRAKIKDTCEGIAPVISAYVIGQMVTSTLCAIYTYFVLLALGVPAALVFAVLAGVFDILPIIGFFLFAIPAALFALSVSTTAAIITLVAFGIYHLIETYFVSPLVYGNRLRVSGIVVLSSLIAGGEIGGITGAIVILPIVASYPVIEKIWLARLLGQSTVDQHELIEESAT